MSKTRKKYQEKEERRHPDSPDGLVVAASKTGRSLSASLAWQDWH
ncbi:hypothetical protein AAHB58_14395 [Enterobacter hormaechei]